jgi:hypothetical protein
LDDVRVTAFEQDADLAVGALCVYGVLESVEVLFECLDFAGAAVGDFPYDSVGSAADLFVDFEAAGEMRFDDLVVGHYAM